MIQRIQSLYFSLAILFQLLFMFGTKLIGETSQGYFYFGMNGLVMLIGEEVKHSDYKSILLSSIAILLLLIAIFKYKSHKLQIKLVNGFLMIIFVQLFFVGMLYITYNDLATEGMTLGWATFMLPISCILAVLGRKGVKKDYKLLKSVDRIR